MPFRKSYPKRYRRRNYRKRPYSKKTARTTSYWNTASRALRLAKLAYGMLNVEYKKIDRSQTSVYIGSATPHETPILTCPVQGNGATERSGSQIEWKNMYIEGQVTRVIGAPSASTICRVVIAYIKQNELTDNSNKIFTEVYDSTNVNALRNLDHTDDWVVLYSKEFVLTSERPTKQIRFFRKFPNNAMKYKFDRSVATGNVTDIEAKCLYMGIVASGTAEAQVAYKVRGTFIDN